MYILLIVRREGDELQLARALQFDRQNLEIVRQKSFDPSGHILSDTSYADWQSYGGIPFPSEIDIKRPQDRYEVRLNVIGVRMNAEDVTPEKFVLNQPPGTELELLSK